MDIRFTHVAVFAATVLFFSCKNAPSRSHGPNDQTKLHDLVSDLNPVITRSSETADTQAAEQKKENTKDTVKKTTAVVATPQAMQLNGLKAEFTEVSVGIPDLVAKQSGNPNLHSANGAVYTWTSGNINGNTVKVSAGVLKVSMRYQSIVILKNHLGTLPLESLSSTTSWEPMNGGNGQYKITGLDEKDLDAPDGNANTIRNAVQKAAQRRHMSRRKAQDWVSSVRNIRATNQKPLTVTLRSVMFKIDGKDQSGKMFSKQIRIDIPL